MGRALSAQRRDRTLVSAPHALLLPRGSSREAVRGASLPDPGLPSVPAASLAVSLEEQVARLPENTHLARGS